jgi:hypothetical protein
MNIREVHYDEAIDDVPTSTYWGNIGMENKKRK